MHWGIIYFSDECLLLYCLLLFLCGCCVIVHSYLSDGDYSELIGLFVSIVRELCAGVHVCPVEYFNLLALQIVSMGQCQGSWKRFRSMKLRNYFVEDFVH